MTRVSARLDELVAAHRGPPAASSPSRPGAPLPPPEARLRSPGPAGGRPRSSGGPSPEQAYQAAYLDFSKGNYPLAVAGFREFVRRYPDVAARGPGAVLDRGVPFSLARASRRGPVGQGDPRARAGGAGVPPREPNYPRGDKVPTALYKEALALIELKQTRLAQARLQYLIENFPQSEEAPLAKERLAILGG